MKPQTLAPDLTPTQMHRTVAAMEKYGGGFCCKLAQAWYVADSRNKLKIQSTFAEYLAEYGPGTYFYNIENN
jgi:hypothetical protein